MKFTAPIGKVRIVSFGAKPGSVWELTSCINGTYKDGARYATNYTKRNANAPGKPDFIRIQANDYSADLTVENLLSLHYLEQENKI